MFDGFGKNIKSFATSSVGQSIGAATAIYGIFKALEWSAKEYNLTYDAAIKNTSESLEGLNSTKEEIEGLEQQTKSYKDTLSTLGEKYNVSFDGAETIDEMISKLRSAEDIDLILTDKSQLATIESENSSLERQIALKEQLKTFQEKTTASNARDTLNLGEKSVADQVAIDLDDGFGKVKRKDSVNNVNIATAVKDDVKAIETYKEELAALENQMVDMEYGGGEWQKAKKDVDEYNKAITTLTQDLDSKQGELSSLLESFSVDGLGLEAISGYEKEFKEVKDAFNALNGMNLTSEQKELKALESFFDGGTGSNFIKEQLVEAAKSGEDVVDVLNRMGLTLGDLGVSSNGEAFREYFDDIAKSAKEAESAIKSIDGSVEGVKTAFESENKDATWNSMAEYLSQAEDLYKKGKVGTDDFKSAVQFITSETINPDAEGFKYDTDAYVAAWENAHGKIKRYFDSDNPLQSVTNFTDDLISKGLASKVGDDITWGFDSSAQAADKLGISVQAVEAIMHNLESYGAEFDDVMFSGEGIDRYKTALDGIKQSYESMEEGSNKERLGGLIKNWESEYEKYQNDLDSLTEDQVIHLEFEYDLASIQAKIDEIQSVINQKGEKNASIDELAERNAGNEAYINTAEQGLGFNVEGFKVPVAYEVTDESIQNLQEQLNQGGLSEEEIKEIQIKIGNAQDLQKDMLDMFSSEHPEINADSNIDEINAAWSDFYSTPKNFKVEGELDASSLESTMDELKEGSTIVFTADLNKDGVEEQVMAIKNQDGTISYVANVGGVLREVSVVEQRDGTVTYSLGGQEDPEGKNAGLYYDMTGQDPAKDDTASVNYKKGTQEAPSAMNAVVNYVKKGANFINNAFNGKNTSTRFGGSQVNGTAHVSGTARTVRYGSAFASGDWSVKRSEKALMGELGRETIVRNGHFFTVGDNGAEFANVRRGDVIFNHKQTDELFRNGYVTSGGGRAKVVSGAFATGTAYANGWRLPSASSSSPTKKKKSYNSSTTKSSKSSSSSKSSAAKATKEAEEVIDWIATLLERVARQTEIAVDAIDTAIGLANKQTATANAISKVQNEISTNQDAYNRYMAQANSVGLSESYASQVRNGSLNIENIKDENLKKKIDDYEKWLISSHVIYFIAGKSPQPYLATT